MKKPSKGLVRGAVVLAVCGAIAAISVAIFSPRVDAIPKIEFLGFDRVSSNRPMAVISISNGCSYPIWVVGYSFYAGRKYEGLANRVGAHSVGIPEVMNNPWINGPSTNDLPVIPRFSNSRVLLPVPSENSEWILYCFYCRPQTRLDGLRYRLNRLAGDSAVSRKILLFGATSTDLSEFKSPVFPVYKPASR